RVLAFVTVAAKLAARACVPGSPRRDDRVPLRRPAAPRLRDALRRRAADHHHVRRDPDRTVGSGRWHREPRRAHRVRGHGAPRVARDGRTRAPVARPAARSRSRKPWCRPPSARAVTGDPLTGRLAQLAGGRIACPGMTSDYSMMEPALAVLAAYG